MASVDFQQRIISAKIVYWGPEGAGKTTNLRHVYQRTRSEGQPEPSMVEARPGHYDRLPLQLGEIRGFQTRFELFTVPDGDAWSEARRGLLDRTDGVVFVGDSRRGRASANAGAFSELARGLASHGASLARLPFVFQCNRSDAPDAVSPAEVAAPIVGVHPHPARVPVFAACATQGQGVFESLKAICKLVLAELKRGA